MDVMAATNKVLIAERVVERTTPITLQTENGFSIIRLSDVNDAIPAIGFVHQFLVRDPDGFELDITVQIAEPVAQELVNRSRGRLTPESSYWLSCAERHLVNYLWEHGDYPPDARLIVAQPILDDFDLALRWDKQTP
jgi:hypothetical protein